MWVIRSNRVFYRQGPNPHWYGAPDWATHFEEEQDAHEEARVVLGLEGTDYLIEPHYPKNPNLPNGGVRPYQPRPVQSRRFTRG